MNERNTVSIRGLPTGVAGLDSILDGGFPEYSLNLVAGPPGSGKTTLVHQIVFANSSRERPLRLSGEVDGNEVAHRVEVILPRLVDDADVAFSGRPLVGHPLVEFSELEIVTSRVANAEEKLPLSWCRGHQSRNRLTFMFTRPTP